jgi:hypothetical protein
MSTFRGLGKTWHSNNALRGVVALFVMFLVWRLSLVALAYFGLNFMGVGKCRQHWQVFGVEHYVLNGHFRWDSAWYRSIMHEGYRPRGSSAAFYPALPYLTRFVGWIVNDWRWGAMIVVNTCTFVATWALCRVSRQELPEVDARLSARLMLVFPTSFFLVSFFSESVYLCFSLLSFLSYRNARYQWAGVWGMAAMLSRSTGVVLFCAFVGDIAWQWWKERKQPPRTALWLLLIPAGLGLFALMQWVQTGEPLAFVKTQSHWRPRPAWPWVPLLRAFFKVDWSLPLHAENARQIQEALIATLTLGGALLMAVRRWRPVYWLYTFGVVLLPLSTGTMMGISRMCLVAFPLYLLGASVFHSRSTWMLGCVVLSTGLLVLTMVRFMGCRWVA